ncbi:MAG: IS200/IS605 family transposase [Planctomycetia bacterium]|nr:IS200/IS605 family transposase [Planctomycetia bacterium]
MPQSFAAMYAHLVFSTKQRAPLIRDEIASRLYPYLGGIATSSKGVLICVGGMPDHVHLLVSLGRESSLSELLRELKANSSRWIHETFPDQKSFAWQSGYAAFSVSHSRLSDVRAYIENQAEHHRVRTFQEEFLELLRRHDLTFDERYVWD